MSTVRVDALEVIYEDDDEGAVSSNGSDEEDYEDDDPHTSLHGHPDHLHSGENDGSKRLSDGKILQALRTENKELRSHLTVLAREIERTNSELARWRTRYRKIEDERDNLKREFDKLASVNSQGSTTKDPSRSSQCTVMYSTHEPDNSEHSPSDFTRQQESNYTEHNVSPVADNNSSQESQQGIPVHRGRLRPQTGNSDQSNNSYRFNGSTEPLQPSGGDFGNARLSARPLNSEALPFSPSWLGPKVPLKDPPEPPSKEGFFYEKQSNSPATSELSVVVNGTFLHSSNSFKQKNNASPLIVHEGHLGPSASNGIATSHGSTIVPLSLQASPPTSNVIQPIQPPRRKSTDSLGRSASTTSTLSNSSSHPSSISSGPSPSSSQHISPALYSPQKGTNSLAKQPSVELNPSMVQPDTFQSLALAQTLRGRAKDILEGRASPGIVRSSERNSAVSPSNVALSMHSVLLNENKIHSEINGVEGSELLPMSLRPMEGSLDPSLIDNKSSYSPISENFMDSRPKDKKTTSMTISLPSHNKLSQQNVDVDGLLEGPQAGVRVSHMENSPGKFLNTRKVETASSLYPQPKKLFSSSKTNPSMVMNAGFQERVDVNRNNNLTEILVQSSPKYPYANTSLPPAPINLENGSILHPNAQRQFSRTLTPGSNLPILRDSAGHSVPINATSLFNIAPIHNGNINAIHNGHANYSQVSIPSANAIPVNLRSFSPDRIIASPPKNIPSVTGFPSSTMHSPPFSQFSHIPVLQDDPDYGPVIVHGPLPPRHAHHQHGQGVHHTNPRRKREPVSVPPRYLGLSAGIPAAVVGAQRVGMGTDFEGGTTNNFGGGGVNHGW